MNHDVSTRGQRHQIEVYLNRTEQISRESLAARQSYELESTNCAEQFRLEREALETAAQTKLGSLEEELTTALEAARREYEEAIDSLEVERSTGSDNASRTRSREITGAKREHEETIFRLGDHYKQDQEQTKDYYKRFKGICGRYKHEWSELFDLCQAYLQKHGYSLSVSTEEAARFNLASDAEIQAYQAASQQVQQMLAELKRRRSIRFLDEGWIVLLLIFSVLGFAWPLGVALDYHAIFWLPATIAAAVITTWGIYLGVRRIAQTRIEQILPELQRFLTDGKSALHRAHLASRAEAEAQLRDLKTFKEQETQASRTLMTQRIEAAEAEFVATRDRIETSFNDRALRLESAWERKTDQIRSSYQPRLAAAKADFETKRGDLQQREHQAHAELAARFAADETRLKSEARAVTEGFRTYVDACRRADRSPEDWSRVTADEWQSPEEPADAIMIGEYAVPQRSDVTLELTDDNIPASTCEPIQLPALLAFPDDASLVIKATEHGRSTGVELLRQAMLKFLTAMPAGKVRYTIIDPVGLGQDFSAFMHLADFDERLVTHRIWTETAHINARLSDLTEHMENVIQKYLRNEFASIQDYNQHAGEVAEPFHVLVVANFPVRFSEEAVRRLISIAQSGPRCGVYPMVTVDMSAKMPRHFHLSDLTDIANTLETDGQSIRWDDELLRQFPVTALPLPDDRTMTQIIKRVGEQAESSSRVEVPFSYVLPDREDWWKFDSGPELQIPLGRSGATQRQSLKLGRGTSQHVLVSGKTGSGKSTLLNALITNAAVHYPPDQLHMYLIDFKKGVEFKPYAQAKLPHARVIAIESEREFGLSVLQRLDQELRRRGDLYRDAGVPSLTAYRRAKPDDAMPRILLIVDEFQEFFVNDDRISHEASLLLDRLVRQGRAFGMHVILGSQTLAGAYSLARSTLGQMAVRIALQCSAADAHLILSDDNTAARLLNRPGEAIYNDANGMLEGNHPFQVVWLSDEERVECLQQISEFAAQQDVATEPAIVFEGQAMADLADNYSLHRLLELGPTRDETMHPKAWLGASIAIKEPTHAVFHRQAGHNLLVVGQDEQAARGVIASGLVGLVAAASPMDDAVQKRAASLYILDDGASMSEPQRAADSLRHLPCERHGLGPADSSRLLLELRRVVSQRLAEPGSQAPPIYLWIHDLARFSDLRAEDDFGLPSFGDSSKEVTAAESLQMILRDGPSVGVHCLVWVDSYNNLTRWMSRSALKEFSLRVMFQMSAVDSSHLIDSTAASHLGNHRAIFYHDGSGLSEKFRPYAVPSSEWLERVARRIGATTPLPSGERLGEG